MKVVLVTHDSALARFVAATLYEASAVDAVLVETVRPNWRFYWRKLRRVGVVDFAFQAWLARWYRREGGRALPARTMPPHERITSANDYPFDPDGIVLGFGTSIITATRFGFCGSTKVRMLVIPSEPKSSLRLGELSQCLLSFVML